MNRLSLLLLIAAFALVGCRQDAAQEAATSVGEPVTAESTEKNTANTPVAAAMEVKGFNFLTACDSLVVSKLVLSGPNGEGDFAYLQGQCVTDKTFELLLVPRKGATPAAEFGDPAAVLAKAAANGYKDHICYAFEMPKTTKINAEGIKEIVDLFPINAVIKRLENNKDWIRLGVDRAEDQTAYNTLRWNILHDKMPQYD